MTLYHGTTKNNFNQIMTSGMINGQVYLSPSAQIAEDYALNNSCDIVVIEVELEISELSADLEFVKNGDSDFLEESLENGSCFADRDILVSEFVSTEQLN